MSDILRGCRTPLDPPEPALADRYDRGPAALYRDSGTSTRIRLNRILYAEIRFAYVQALAREKNLEGLQHADAIDREVPEFHAQAEKLRETTLDERLASAATLSRGDVLQLAERFQMRGQPDKAMQAKKAWVLAGDERIRKEGRPDDMIHGGPRASNALGGQRGSGQAVDGSLRPFARDEGNQRTALPARISSAPPDVGSRGPKLPPCPPIRRRRRPKADRAWE